MIHFTPPDEPVNFDRDVRQPGIAWLERNSVEQRVWLRLPNKIGIKEMVTAIHPVIASGFLKGHQKMWWKSPDRLPYRSASRYLMHAHLPFFFAGTRQNQVSQPLPVQEALLLFYTISPL